MLKKANVFVTTIVLFLVIVGCDSKYVYDQYNTIPNHWHKDSISTFSFKSPDTINKYNLFVNIRCNNNYPFNNLFLITELNYPNGKTIKDTLEYRMAAPNGELLGEGFSDIKESKLWYKGYKEAFKFSEEGDYQIRVQHAMRKIGNVDGVTKLEGITDLGFRIEKVQK